MHTADSERNKYEITWNHPWYRINSPALRSLKHIRAWIDKHAIQQLVDYGCGSGKLDFELWRDGRDVRMVDIAENCLDSNVRKVLNGALTFETGCLWDENVKSIRGDGVICIDVLEHLPPDRVDEVCEVIRNTAPHGFVNAALFPHKYKGADLHLTLKPPQWWFERFPDAKHSVVKQKHAFMIW